MSIKNTSQIIPICNCDYCNTWTYCWDISKNTLPNNTVWIEIPKNASAVLKKYLFHFTYSAETRIKKDFVNHYDHGLIFLRDPIIRFKSLLSHYFLDGTRRKEGDEWLRFHNIIINDIEQEIANVVIDNFDKLITLKEPHHFFSQCSFIPFNFWNIKNINIIDTKKIKNTYPNIPIHNMSSSHRIHLSDVSVERIKQLYQDDISLYNQHINNYE